jgi:methyl-accepting chemotaxis protein
MSALRKTQSEKSENQNMELIDNDGALSIESNEYIQAINRSQSIIEFDLSGKVLTANANFLKTTGYSIEEIKGKPHSIFCETDYASSLDYKDFWQKLFGGEFVSGEFKRLSKSGREIWLMASYNPILDGDGKLYKIIKIATDITDSKSELKVRTDIMNLTSIVSESDLKGNILSINEKFCQTSQYSPDELLGKPHNTTRHPDMPKEVFKTLWGTIGRGQIFRGIVKNRKKDGTPYYVDAVIAPIMGENGKPKKYLGVRYDITESETERHNMRGLFDAIDSSYAYIEFDINGNVLSFNKNFSLTMGYSIDEIKGKHHRMFVEPAMANTPAYAQFWTDLKNGQSQNNVFRRFTKDGREVWLQAVYAPVKDEMGRVQKVIKIATDVTKDKVLAADNAGKMAAIDRAQAVIEFNLDGTITNANENFLKTLGYDISEIKGKHHRIFCESQYANSPSYSQLWTKLAQGELEAGEFKRIGKGGKEVWINASYNPIFDLNGKPYKVVKYATDITKVKNMIHSVEETARILSSSSQELTTTATEMSKTASQTNKESVVAAAAAEEVAAGVQTVATNIEEMVASIKEISRSTAESSQMAKTTMARAQDTNKSITQLGISSQEIGDVIKVISSIAQQTNLLALNATIEAARAGDAGRGFAVVANEVKELAKQTAKATHEITNKIGAIQKDTQNAVEAIGGISQAVEKLNGISGVIAAAVEEQTATTNEVSRVVIESKKGVEAIAANIKSVSQASTNSTAASEQTLAASKDLASLAVKLNALVSQGA